MSLTLFKNKNNKVQDNMYKGGVRFVIIFLYMLKETLEVKIEM